MEKQIVLTKSTFLSILCIFSHAFPPLFSLKLLRNTEPLIRNTE